MTSYDAVSYANTTAAGCFALQPSQAQVACSSQQLNITDPPRCGPRPAAQGRSLALLPRPLKPRCAGPCDSWCPSTCSIYSWDLYSYLWQPVTCLLSNATYSDRVDVPGAFPSCAWPADQCRSACLLPCGIACSPALSSVCAAHHAASYNWCSVPLKGSDAFLFVALALLVAICLFGKLSAVWVLVAGGPGWLVSCAVGANSRPQWHAFRFSCCRRRGGHTQLLCQSASDLKQHLSVARHLPP